MNINFSSLKTLKINNNFQNIKKLTNFSTNPINFKGSEKQDTVEFSDETQILKSRIENLELQLEDYKTRQEQLKEDFNNSVISKEEYEAQKWELSCLEASVSIQLKKTNTKLNKIQDFNNSGILQTRPNAAFFYDPRLTIAQKREELKKHPEFKTIKEIAIEAGNEKAASSLNTITRFFVRDAFDGEIYIDTTLEENVENYKYLLANLKGKINLYTFASRNDIPYNFLKNLVQHGTIERLELTNIKTGKKGGFDLIPEDLEKKADNIKKLIPTKSKYFKQLIRDRNKPILAPAMYLARMGFGTPNELYANYKKGYLKGVERDVEKDGVLRKYFSIDINSDATEHNLRLLKAQNKNYYTVKDLARALHIRRSEIERAVIDGELESSNEYIFSDPQGYTVGINLSNPKNEKFASRLAFEQEMKASLLSQHKIDAQRNKTIMGLRSKIAWYLSPKTSKIASDLAIGDGFLIQTLAKEDRINNSEETSTETLSKAENIKIKTYRKNMWEQAGSEEFSQGSKKAVEIVNLYLQQGIEAIEDEKIRKIIEDYMS